MAVTGRPEPVLHDGGKKPPRTAAQERKSLMITTCTGCQTRYRLDREKVPRRVIRVRCPGCAQVFTLDGTCDDLEAPVLVGAAAVQDTAAASGRVARSFSVDLGPGERPVRRAAESDPAPPIGRAASEDLLQGESHPAPQPCVAGSAKALETATASTGTATAATTTAVGTATATAVAEEEETARPTRRRDRDKARMLARALVSDILVYNRERRDAALTDGTLLASLGPEIKKSWELYKEKVGEEAANGTTHFRDALNEILADGQHLF
ncbi:MAG: zinc-ribbon domain-containing protein [Candidatus Krumholzibacteriia bacterium]